MIADATQEPPASPFATAARQLIGLGYHPLPLLPSHVSAEEGRGKAPGEFKAGRWSPMFEWQRFRDRQPTDFELRLWCKNWPDANVGVVLGSPAGGLKLIAVDIDTTDADEFDDLVSVLPRSPMTKRGAKGLTLFYRAPADIRSRQYRVPTGDLDTRGRPKTRTVLDLLTGNQTRQTVMPPSVHPEGPVYAWVGQPVPADSLPVFDEDALAKLEDTLSAMGWDTEAKAPETRAAEPRDPADEPTIWGDLNAAALDNIEAWVHDLDLYNLKATRRGGYEAVATWRPSSSGRPLSLRKRNLQIHPSGIKDFGEDKGYSALDLVQAARSCDLDEAFAWLSQRLGGGKVMLLQPTAPAPAPVVAENDAGQLVVVETGQVVGEPALEPGTAELPDHLTRPGGLVGDLVDWITATARRPSRVLALTAALTIVGTAAGRQFSGPTRTGTHLYVLGMARTSAGKDHPLKQAGRVLKQAGLEHHIGPSEFISMPAAIKFLGRSPLSLCPMDEFGAFLKRINNRKASGFEGAISGILRTAWGSSFQMMTTPEWAGQESRAIHAPAMSVLGTTTPEEFYGALAAADATNGVLNRFLVIETRTRPAEQDPEIDPFVVPSAIVEGVRRIYYATGELYAAGLNQSDQDRAPRVVPWADERAKQVYRDFGRMVEARSDRDPVAGAFMGRTVEMAQRMATIVALGRSAGDATVTVADMEWGRDVALWSAEVMIQGAAEHMSENEHQAQTKTVLNLVRQAGRISRNDLVRRIDGRIENRTLEAILKGLVEGERIWQTSQAAGPSGGRPRTLFVYGPPPDEVPV